MNRLNILLGLVLVAVLVGCGTDEASHETNHNADNSSTAQSADNHDDHGGEEAGHEGEEAGHEGEDAHDESEQTRTLELTAAQERRLSIQIEDATSGSASDTVSAPATLTYDKDRIARVGPRLEAKVVRVIADLGDRVEAGDPLVELDSVALGKAKARHLTTKARLDTVRAQYEREHELNEKEITSDAELQEARALLAEARAEHDSADEELRLYGLSPQEIDSVEPDADVPFSRYILTSPINGTVQHRDVVPGQTVGANETPVTIVDTSTLWLMIEASESDAGLLQAGQSVDLVVRSLPTTRFSGELDWISSSLDRESRTLTARAGINNPDGVLRDGMFGTARVQIGEAANRTLVPLDAVQELEGQDIVFVPGEETGHFRAVPVTLGAENDRVVEILAGLAPGDSVVVSGAFDLKSALTAATRSAAHSH
ncbi:MAG: efflux RND transporter periplasmic adaptor subunit [Pseudomonadota bacterium]|nr:MAG: efflux RND transporter periplasmic adaptor subunit [Pseudomonadota bacterium]